MCGAAGVVVRGGAPHYPGGAVGLMMCAEAQRGADEEGSVAVQIRAAWAGLEHRKLSILNLSHTGQQAIAAESGGYFTVFNGEIFRCHQIEAERTYQGGCGRTSPWSHSRRGFGKRWRAYSENAKRCQRPEGPLAI